MCLTYAIMVMYAIFDTHTHTSYRTIATNFLHKLYIRSNRIDSDVSIRCLWSSKSNFHLNNLVCISFCCWWWYCLRTWITAQKGKVCKHGMACVHMKSTFPQFNKFHMRYHNCFIDVNELCTCWSLFFEGILCGNRRASFVFHQTTKKQAAQPSIVWKCLPYWLDLYFVCIDLLACIYPAIFPCGRNKIKIFRAAYLFGNINRRKHNRIITPKKIHTHTENK